MKAKGRMTKDEWESCHFHKPMSGVIVSEQPKGGGDGSQEKETDTTTTYTTDGQHTVCVGLFQSKGGTDLRSRHNLSDIGRYHYSTCSGAR